MARNQEIADSRVTLKTFPTPLATDVLFYIMRDATLPKNLLPVYGTKFDDIQPRKESWPDHVLVFISPADANNQQRWYFAATRDKQDDYNFLLDGGSQLLREYVIPRNTYFARLTAETPGEFLALPAATLDTRFAQFGFADDTIMDAGEILRSHFIIIRRRFIEPVTAEIKYSDQFEMDMLITKEVIAPTIIPVKPVDPKGQITEIQHANIFHDVRITQQLISGYEEDGTPIPATFDPAIELTPTPGYANYTFPARLDSVNIALSWAWAFSDTAVSAYAEDYYFEWKTTDPRRGPYEATVRRFITDDPDALRSQFTLYEVPSTRRETVGISYSWWESNARGNRANAVAKEQEVPPTIHAEIPITINGMEVAALENRTALNTDTLHATPGFDAFMDAVDNTVEPLVIGFDTRKMPLGLYEVSVTTLYPRNLYSTYANGSTTTQSGGSGSVIVCNLGDTVVLDASSIVSTTDPVNYIWSTGYGNVQAGTANTFTIDPVTITSPTKVSCWAELEPTSQTYPPPRDPAAPEYLSKFFTLDIRPDTPVLTAGSVDYNIPIAIQIDGSWALTVEIEDEGSFNPHFATFQFYDGLTGDTSTPVDTEQFSGYDVYRRGATCYIPIDAAGVFTRWVRISNITGSIDSATYTITVA